MREEVTKYMLAFGILKAKRGLIDLNMFAEFADVVDIKGLCKMLNIGKNKAYELLNLGKIKTFRFG